MTTDIETWNEELFGVEESLSFLEALRENITGELNVVITEESDSLQCIGINKVAYTDILNADIEGIVDTLNDYNKKIDVITKSIQNLNKYRSHLKETIETGGYTIED